MRRLISAFAVLLGLALPAHATCNGQNLLASLAPSETAALDAAVAAQPYPTGNFWRATKGDQRLTLVGTYHLDDPRHAATVAALAPHLATATTLLVEAGPKEEAALKRDLANNPDLLFITTGPSLMQQMQPEDWQALTTAMAARNIPGFMAAKFKPWYISMMLAMPPCDLDRATAANGLDHQLMALAETRSLPIRALEPHTTLFAIFDQLTPAEQLEMIRMTLLIEDQAADYAVTLADLYFAQDSRRMWEFTRLQSHTLPGYTPEQADAEYARIEELLMSARNRAWIPVIEATTATGPTFAAFGALHLAGQDGVLALLSRAGWTVEPLPL